MTDRNVCTMPFGCECWHCKPYECPGREMPQPAGAPEEGYVACYLAGHECPTPPKVTREESHGQVTTTWRCPCCGDFQGAMTMPVGRFEDGTDYEENMDFTDGDES